MAKRRQRGKGDREESLESKREREERREESRGIKIRPGGDNSPTWDGRSSLMLLEPWLLLKLPSPQRPQECPTGYYQVFEKLQNDSPKPEPLYILNSSV